MDDRRLTVIIVPDGDPETRTLHIPYTRVRLAIGAALLVIVLFIVMASSWWYVAAQAARVPGLERQVGELEAEREKVAELARMLAEVEEQYEQVRQMLGAGGTGSSGDAAEVLPPLRQEPDPNEGNDGPIDATASLPSVWPLTQAGFITRQQQPGEESHPGLDIAVPSESVIRAAGAGTVVEAAQSDVYGRFLRIDHGGGYESVYGHASFLFVSEGDEVEQREIIALSGSTGRSSAPHLHFEIRKDGRAIDPLALLERS